LEENAWQYVLTDQSPELLKQLIADAAVEGTTNIDSSGRVLREPPWVVVRRWLHIPVLESPLLTRENGTIWLYDALFFTPLIAAALLAFRSVRHRTLQGEGPTVVMAIVLAVLFNIFLIRGNTDSRLPDILVPNVLLWAWLWRTLLSDAPNVVTVIGTTAVAWSLLMAVDLYSNSMDHLGATDLLSMPMTTARHLKWAVTGLLHPLNRFAPPGSPGLRALVRYVNRCTSPADRLLVLGYQPEFFFYSDRRMAGGNPFYQSNLGAAPQQQQQIVAWLQHERVPVVILPMDRLFDIDSTYVIVKRYVDGRYTVAKESGFGEGRPFRVLVDSQAVSTRLDEETGLPCFAD
jgi:hypothetical protein